MTSEPRTKTTPAKALSARRAKAKPHAEHRSSKRVELYQSNANRDGVLGMEWRWSMQVSSDIVDASTETYKARAAALRNLASAGGGHFTKTSTPDEPEPFGVLSILTSDAYDETGRACGAILEELVPVTLRK